MRKVAFLMVFFGGVLFISNDTLADCNLTTSPGTNGRCFMSGGEYKCKEREEDTNCKTEVTTETEEGEGGN